MLKVINAAERIRELATTDDAGLRQVAARALADMARHKPASEADFAEIHGVGAAKLRAFAEPFLRVIAEFMAAADPVTTGG